MPPKGKADTAGYQQLKKDLSAQAPGKLYILHGEETYLRDYCLNQLKELILSGGMGTFNFHEIPAKEMSPRRLEEALDGRFHRLGRSMVVNLEVVRRGTKTQVVLSDGSVLPLPRGAYEGLNRAIIAHS